MKTINEIFVNTQIQKPNTEEELRLGLLSLGYLQATTEQLLVRLADAVVNEDKEARLIGLFALIEAERLTRARNTTPETFLGEQFTPGTPKNQELLKEAGETCKQILGIDLIQEAIQSPEGVEGALKAADAAIANKDAAQAAATFAESEGIDALQHG